MNDFESELVVCLVSAVGTENKLVMDLLDERLMRAGYEVHIIKVSRHVIPNIHEVPDHGGDNYSRISNLMDAGNAARAKSNDDSVLALGAASRIFAMREKESGLPKGSPKTAYIIDSLKRPEEVAKLRQIYASGMILVGVHATEERRKNSLVTNQGIAPERAEELIGRDANEARVEHGQRVNKTFHMADFFVRISNSHDQLRCDLNRMVSLWFGNPFITPTFDEHAMFMAFGAALRSADMSRQVGAVVTRDSQILSAGANDCPKAGGGLYWPERNLESGCIEDFDGGRDFTRCDGDSNRAEQLRMIEGIVKTGKEKYGFDAVKMRELLEKSPLRDLTEFGRVVHAEMEALLSCGRSGFSTIGTTLYSTTFPCHNCAKHIVAAGVARVVYIEPYPKSKALEFHNDSIAGPGKDGAAAANYVNFDAFVGIGPRRFFDFFSMHLGSSYELRRKEESGKKSEWTIEKSRLRISMKPTTYLDNELLASRTFDTLQESVKNPSRK